MSFYQKIYKWYKKDDENDEDMKDPLPYSLQPSNIPPEKTFKKIEYKDQETQVGYSLMEIRKRVDVEIETDANLPKQNTILRPGYKPLSKAFQSSSDQKEEEEKKKSFESIQNNSSKGTQFSDNKPTFGGFGGFGTKSENKDEAKPETKPAFVGFGTNSENKITFGFGGFGTKPENKDEAKSENKDEAKPETKPAFGGFSTNSENKTTFGFGGFGTKPENKDEAKSTTQNDPPKINNPFQNNGGGDIIKPFSFTFPTTIKTPEETKNQISTAFAGFVKKDDKPSTYAFNFNFDSKPK